MIHSNPRVFLYFISSIIPNRKITTSPSVEALIAGPQAAALVDVDPRGGAQNRHGALEKTTPWMDLRG